MKNVEKPKIKQHVEIRVNDGDEWESVKILSRRGNQVVNTQIGTMYRK